MSATITAPLHRYEFTCRGVGADGTTKITFKGDVYHEDPDYPFALWENVARIWKKTLPTGAVLNCDSIKIIRRKK
jgi:hypothetical protein